MNTCPFTAAELARYSAPPDWPAADEIEEDYDPEENQEPNEEHHE
jgi:hypothetical protein